MPVDTSIYFNRFPVQVNPAAAMAKGQQYRNLVDQHQIHQQELQLNQETLKKATAANATAERDAQDQEIIRKAYVQANGQPEQTIQAAIQGGAGPRGVQDLQKHFGDLAEHTAKTDSDKLAVSKAKNDQFLALHDAALRMSPEQLAQAWPQIYQQLTQLDPETAKRLDPNNPPPRDTIEISRALHSTLDYFSKGEIEKRAQAEEVRKQAEEARKAALAGPQLQSAQNAAANSTPDAVSGLTHEQAAVDTRAAAAAAETVKRDANTEADRKVNQDLARGRLSAEQGRLKIEQDRMGTDGTTAQMIAAGSLDPQTTRAMLRRNPNLMTQVHAIDPEFDEGNIDNRYNTLKEFSKTSAGSAGGQALALNTMIHHADLYLKAGEALKNGSFKPGNAAYNAIAEMMGSAPPQNAALVARFLAGETAKVATGGVPAEGEIKGMLAKLGTDSSPEQIADAGKTLLQIAAGRATPLIERATKAKITKIVDVIGPDAKEILTRRGFNPDTMKANTGGGKPAQGGYIVGRKYGGKEYLGGDVNDGANWK